MIILMKILLFYITNICKYYVTCYLLVSCSENHDANNIITIGREKEGNYLYRNE